MFTRSFAVRASGFLGGIICGIWIAFIPIQPEDVSFKCFMVLMFPLLGYYWGVRFGEMHFES